MLIRITLLILSSKWWKPIDHDTTYQVLKQHRHEHSIHNIEEKSIENKLVHGIIDSSTSVQIQYAWENSFAGFFWQIILPNHRSVSAEGEDVEHEDKNSCQQG